ncbi:MAG TPA: glycoside hydrolase family 130 protein [Pseudomonadales bacterium]|nr:glycoside hydrolase family 130 protein [Pseudomonadales bacterium]
MKRKGILLKGEHARTITRAYFPGDLPRLEVLIERLAGLDDAAVAQLLESVIDDFGTRHRYFEETLVRSFERLAERAPESRRLSPARQLLLGAYFTQEYSIESAAFFNPSIVPHPDQADVAAGAQRFIMSFRATGEGHVSSIEFRSGVIDAAHELTFDPVSPYVETPQVHPDPAYSRLHFQRKLEDIGAHAGVVDRLLEGLGEEFSLAQLQQRIARLEPTRFRHGDKVAAIDAALWLARSNYECVFREDHRISERVIFPVTENEARGIEDARFVRFTNDDGSVVYYATFTAYNGVAVLSQLLETTDFLTFKMRTLNGNAVSNKGMALFPRRIGGRYVMLSRQDGVNNYIMYSDNLLFWNDATRMQEPTHPAQFMQIGNCGSPVETPEGWLLLIHGVGPMRCYTIWAVLLDLDDPARVIGRLDEPLLAPDEHERDGYVPNAVYTCGCMLHGDELIIPYGIADQRCSVATIGLSGLLTRLRAAGA